MYILPSLSFLSTPSLPSADQLKRAWATTVTIVCWAVALTFTAGRLSRQLWEVVRPGLARVLHALALLLDPQLPSYPDQPEPDPTPDPQIEFLDELAFRRALEEAGHIADSLAPQASEAPARSIFDGAIDRVITASKAPVASRPARRRTTAKAA